MLVSTPSSGWNAEQEKLSSHFKCTLGRKKKHVAPMTVTHKPIAITPTARKISTVVATPRKIFTVAATPSKIPIIIATARKFHANVVISVKKIPAQLHLLVSEGALDVKRPVLNPRQQPIKLLLCQKLNKQRRTLPLNPPSQ